MIAIGLVAVAAFSPMRSLHLPRRTSPVRLAVEATDEVLYAVGLSVARQLGELQSLLSKDEMRQVTKAMSAKLVGEEDPNFDWVTYGPQVETLLMERTQQVKESTEAAAQGFRAGAASEPGAVTTSSGLIFKSLTEGSGATPQPGQMVTAHYTGALTDGTVFDSSVARGEPLTFPLEGVIKGWQEGLQLMKEGGSAKLTIPSDLAYGDQGTGPIAPGSTLVFEVELIKVEWPPSQPPQQ